jgi:hypothetical protein
MRLKKLKSRQFDETGLVPDSDAWHEFYRGQLDRLIAGEDVPRIPLAVIDRIVEEVDRAEQAEKDCLAALAPIRGQSGHAMSRCTELSLAVWSGSKRAPR